MNRVTRAAAAVVDAAPDWLRHAAILFGSSAAGVVLKAVIAAEGVTGVDWSRTLVTALDTAAATTAAGLLLLVATPATRRYGVGSGQPAGGPDAR